jgi:hypothetical protein
MALLALAVLVLLPCEAWAWGPITHLAHGSAVLQDLNIAPVALQQLLTRHALAYLYGCIGADITQAKKYTVAMAAHCHSWAVGWQVHAAARTAAERAFAWGYLSHLAADVYSHNHFVPTQLLVSYPARALRHVYWETRCDSLQDPALCALLADLRRRTFPDCDALVERAVARTLFSFRTNKRIFESVLAWQAFEQWHRVVRVVDAISRFPLPAAVVARYNELCTASIANLLRHGRHSQSQAADPTGREALTQAMALRNTLRTLHRARRITPALQREIDALALRPKDLPLPPLAHGHRRAAGQGSTRALG